jgi:hypothetical protein
MVMPNLGRFDGRAKAVDGGWFGVRSGRVASTDRIVVLFHIAISGKLQREVDGLPSSTSVVLPAENSLAQNSGDVPDLCAAYRGDRGLQGGRF